MGILLLLTLLGWKARAQGFPSYHYTPTYTPPPMNMPYGNYGRTSQNLAYRKGAGSYQLPDGSWQAARAMTFTGTRLVVKDSLTGKHKFTADAVHQLQIGQDTFLVANHLPGRLAGADGTDFVQSQFNRGGVRLLTYYGNGRPFYYLRLPGKPLLLLPGSKAGFKMELLALVKECPALAAQLEDGTLGRDAIVQILQEYVECRRKLGASSK